MRKLLMSLTVCCLVLAWGCQNAPREEPSDGGGTGTPTERAAERGVAQLSSFESEQEMEEFFKTQVMEQNSRFEDDLMAREESDGVEEATGDGAGADDADAAPAPPADPGQGQSNAGDAVDSSADFGEGDDEDYSGTTIQEEGVDEADVIKTDGDYIYILTGQELQIVKASPPAEMEVVGSFALEGWGQDLYLVGDRAVALTSVYGPRGTGGGAADGVSTGSSAAQDDDGEVRQVDAEPAPPPPDGDVAEGFIEPWYVPRPRALVTVIDLADRSQPGLISQTAFDGHVAASRMIDGVLRLVLANPPHYYYDVMPLGAPEDELGLSSLNVETILPRFERRNAGSEPVAGNVVTWRNLFRPVDPDGFGVTTIITLDSANPDTFDAVGVLADPGLIYASTEALYMTDTAWYYEFRRVETDIYKFAFEPDTVEPVAAGKVPGRILNQYSMGEYDGYLRVATTTDDLWEWETGERIPSHNAVYVLGENEGDLTIVGKVEDMAVGEQIQSARFIGTRGYVVTFERIDPLFTLDLSNPAEPKVVGELKVPGFSTFIVPMDADHLLTVGVYVDPEGPGWGQGVQMSVFDVSDFANPVQTHSQIIGHEGTWSEATHNPKAFTYFSSQDLVALPVEHYERYFFEDGVAVDVDVDEGGDGQASPGEEAPEVRQADDSPLGEDPFRGLLVYRVTAQDGFQHLGNLSTDVEDMGYWPSFTRGVFIQDHVYAVTDYAVVTAPSADIDQVTASVLLPGVERPVPPTTGPEPDPVGDPPKDEPVSDGGGSDDEG